MAQTNLLADAYKERFRDSFRLPIPANLEPEMRAKLGVLRVDESASDRRVLVIRFTDGSSLIRPFRPVTAAEIRKDPA